MTLIIVPGTIHSLPQLTFLREISYRFLQSVVLRKSTARRGVIELFHQGVPTIEIKQGFDSFGLLRDSGHHHLTDVLFTKAKRKPEH